MYDKTYQGKPRPFSAAANILHYFPAFSAELALRQSKACLDRQSGPALILGSAGTGKTLMLDLLADAYATQFQVVHLACARGDSRRDILQGILFQLGQSYRELTESELRLELLDYLRPGPHCPNGILLLVDDAHCLEASILDELRVLSGVIRGGQLRCMLVMAANPSLDERLSEVSQESLNQRIAARCYLVPFTQAETRDYIRLQLQAISDQRDWFSLDAIQAVVKCTHGVPRLVNQLCESILEHGPKPISAATIQSIWAEMQRFPEPLPGENTFSQDAFPQSCSAATTISPQATTVEFGLLDDEGPGQSLANSGAKLPTGRNLKNEDECEGRLTPESIAMERARQSFVERRFTIESSALRESDRVDAGAMARSISQPKSDIDPDFPNSAPDPLPVKTASQPTNPFEETFETEEVISDRYFQAAISHNRSAAVLTRPLLDEFQLDQVAVAVGLGNPGPVQVSANSEIAEASMNSADLTVSTETLPLHVANDIDLSFSQGMSNQDDRDVLVVSHANQQFYNRLDQASVDLEQVQRPLSTGRAIRMDYKQLFARLRQAQQDNRSGR